MISRVPLCDIEIVEIEGEFKQIKRNEEVLPAMLTNHSLYVGKRDGLLETSLTEEFYNIYKIFGDKDVDPEEIKEEDLKNYGVDIFKDLAEVVDDEKVLKIIYLGLVGANPKLPYTFDEFAIKYHGYLEDKMTLYVELISSFVAKDNKFKIEFEKNTSTARGKGEKK